MSYRACLVAVALASSLGACAPKASTTSSATQTAGAAATRAACGQTDRHADYRGLRVGSIVRLHKHAVWEGDTNWSEDMDHYVDQVTRVTELVGVDNDGCPGVHVETDAGVFFWRVRDLEVVQATADDDRRCGQSELAPDYLGLTAGAAVTIGEGSAWFGQKNWVEPMQAFVGKQARVTQLSGVDKAGCPGVALDVDQGAYFWRVRDLARSE